MFTLERKQSLGSYIVAFPVKEGAYAETYRVKDATGKNRFLKLINLAKLHRSQFDSEGRVLEVEIAKQLNHPNIVGYHDSGETMLNGNKYAYVVFNFISGETCSDRSIRERDFSVYDTVTIVSGVLNGLKFLHNLPTPVIHNELTIQNVMLDMGTGYLVPRIIDFGYARYLNQGVSAFNKNGLNPFYVAPEAMNGVFSVKSDIYSVGAMMYHMLFGLPPYFFDTSKVINNPAQLQDEMAYARQKPIDIPQRDKYELTTDLINVMATALANDPEDRFKDADEFIKALNGEIKVDNPSEKRKVKSGDTEAKRTKVEVPKGKGFSAIAGMQDLKAQMQEEVIDVLSSPEEFAEYGLTIPNGMLLYGPPGCGKTFFAKHFAEEVGFNIIMTSGSELKSKWVNGTEENISQMFKDAEEKAPTIIFIEEIDDLVPNRSNDLHQMHKGAVNAMLSHMDRTGEKGIFIIGACNYPTSIDPAILRAGRLDKKYFIGPPDYDGRKAIFELYLKARPLDFGIDYDKLAGLTNGYVSADLELIVKAAALMAKRDHAKITMAHLEKAISDTKPSLSAKIIEEYKAIKAQMDGEAPDKPSRPRVGFR